ncbi:MAG: 4Fe-4S dicluster domain-containing protein [Bacteroidota bacterium]
MKRISFGKEEWNRKLSQLIASVDIYAPVKNESSCDYTLLRTGLVPEIVYNKPKPVTPLKNFFLPVKENVTLNGSPFRPLVIIGPPQCDVMALSYLDEIYLDQEYTDPVYAQRRKDTTLVSMDCLSIQGHCHCTSYGIEPIGDDHADLSIAVLGDRVILTVFGSKGQSFIESMGILVSPEPEQSLLQSLETRRKEVFELLKTLNSGLPDYLETGKLVSSAGKEIWKKYASTCVSCGACSAICPTCSCFILIDRTGFEKIRQLDTCQYPGFERVAGGEDALHTLSERFKNRYLCKYVWKPQKYALKACTGCGRCIETCIGKINKNELFAELSS